MIRASKNPKEAREKLVARFDLSEAQAQAILDMRLQRLTNLEILTLRKEYEEVCKLIDRLEGILKSEKKLLRVIRDELTELKEKYADPRRTELVGQFETVEIVQEEEPAEEVAVAVTRAGFIKRLPRRVYEKAAPEELDADTVLLTQTNRKLLFFTNRGNLYALAAQQAPECQKIKDRGLPPSGLFAGWEKDERLVAAFRAGNVRRRAFVCLRQWYGQARLAERIRCPQGQAGRRGAEGRGRNRLRAASCSAGTALGFAAGHGDPFCRGRHSRAGAHSRGREGHDPRTGRSRDRCRAE